MDVMTYRAPRPGPLFLVIHGAARNAAAYRDHARVLADRFGGAVAVPLFDARRFPTWRFQQAGVLRAGRPVPPGRWTTRILSGLVAAVPGQLKLPADTPVVLVGHSAGALLLQRAAAADPPSGVARIVAANGLLLVAPTTRVRFPRGLGGLPDPEGALRRYLAQPLTVFVGRRDPAFARLKAGFASGRQAASRRGWPFAWRLVVVPGVGHDHARMFAHPAMADALGLTGCR